MIFKHAASVKIALGFVISAKVFKPFMPIRENPIKGKNRILHF